MTRSLTQGGRGSAAVTRYLEAARLRARASQTTEVAPLYALPTQSALAPVAADEHGVPDLLHPRRALKIDRSAARRALEFAFVAGDSAGLASNALSGAAIADSDWQPESFERELFLDELIESCLRFQVAGKPAPIDRGYLKRLLSCPPRDPQVTAFRHAVLAELRERAELRDALLDAYTRLVKILQLFDESSSNSRYDMPRWRLDLLGAIRAFFECLHGPFASCSSGLSRLHEYAVMVRDSRGYAELCSLLDFEGDMAQVDLHLCLGADGKIRRLEVRHVAEQERAPFYRGPLARLLWRIAMVLRGYKVGEVELVERWFDHVYAGVLDFLPALLQLRGDLEFHLASCHFERVAGDRGLGVCIPEFVDPESDAQTHADAQVHKQLDGLFNPLLLPQRTPTIPCDLDVDSFARHCILTGPNSGGKTRLLQALSLTQMLAQAGCAVPARRAVLRRASGMFASFSQESSADQREGRLGTELMRIRQLFERALPGSLVILDELCSGTNPSEGEEIFHLVIQLLRELHPEVFITTHFLQFAAKLTERADELGLCFLQVELDDRKVPTYQFVPGVATTSLAHQTAARLGVTHDELLALIRKHTARQR